MSRQDAGFPFTDQHLFLTYAGIETDLLFTKGIDLPGFAAFPLLETAEGRELLRGYYTDLIVLARDRGLGAILESATWVANRDRGAALGYDAQTLATRNRQAIDLMAEVRAQHPDTDVILSANIGPRADAYAPTEQMTAEAAQTYHSAQMAVLAQTPMDVVSGYTIADPVEAIGIIRAARQYDLPVIISFTLEVDGHLPSGGSLAAAIEAVDRATDAYARYYLVNCAHPAHIKLALQDAPWMQRLNGIVANASRCSHAELDNAKELDAGNPQELGLQLAALRATYPHLSVFGGCCGTDMRHLAEIARHLG